MIRSSTLRLYLHISKKGQEKGENEEVIFRSAVTSMYVMSRSYAMNVDDDCTNMLNT